MSLNHNGGGAFIAPQAQSGFSWRAQDANKPNRVIQVINKHIFDLNKAFFGKITKYYIVVQNNLNIGSFRKDPTGPNHPGLQQVYRT